MGHRTMSKNRHDFLPYGSYSLVGETELHNHPNECNISMMTTAGKMWYMGLSKEDFS